MEPWIITEHDFEEPDLATTSQITFIESLLRRAPLHPKKKELIYMELYSMSPEEASHTIHQLQQIAVPDDPKEQFNRMQF